MSQSKITAWVVWGLGSIFYFYECLLQVSPGVMSNELMRDFAVTSQTLGVLSGVYFYSYAAMQMPGGILLDYFGPRRLLTLATLICAISTIAFGMTHSFYMACLARLMIGFGSAFAAVGSMKLAANWFPAERFAFFTGLMVTIGMLGAIGGEAPLALLVDNFGWRESMIIMGIIGIVIAILLYIIAKDSPSELISADNAHHKQEPIIKGLITLLRNPQLWLVAFYGGLMYMATPVFCGLWGVLFLMEKMHLTKPEAANYISLVFVGWAISGPLWGLFSNKIARRKPPMIIGSIGVILTFTTMLYLPTQSNFLIEAILFLFGIFSAGFLPSFAIAKELCDKRYVATGLSFMNMMNMIGIALAQPLVGAILDRLWDGTMANGVRVYPIHAFHTALAILPIGFVIALLILPFIKETYCKNITEAH